MTADTLLGPDHQAGRNLMRAAVRLLSRGKPITLTELAAAAGVDVADLDNAPAGHDVEYDDEHRIVGWGLTLNPTPHTFVVDGRRLYTWCAADTLLFPAILGRPARGRITLSDNGYSRSLDRRPAVRSNRPYPGLGGDLDTSVRGAGCRAGTCELLQPGPLLRQCGGRRGLARAVSHRNGVARRRRLSATAPHSCSRLLD